MYGIRSSLWLATFYFVKKSAKGLTKPKSNHFGEARPLSKRFVLSCLFKSSDEKSEVLSGVHMSRSPIKLRIRMFQLGGFNAEISFLKIHHQNLHF
jgi:hypothetical protein